MKLALGVAVLGVSLSAGASAFGQVSPDRVDPAVPQPPTAQGAVAQRGSRGIVPPQDRISASVSVGGSYTVPGNYGDSGNVSIYRGGGEATVYIPAVPDEVAVTVGFLEEGSWYDFQNKPNVVNQMFLTRVSPGIFWKYSDDWAFLGGFNVTGAGEKDADVGDALTFGGFAGARYTVSPTLKVTLGVAGSSELEDDPTILPLIGVDWDFAKDWNFSVKGPGVRLTYALTDTVDLSLQGSYESRAYRLDDHFGALDSAVFRDRRATVGLQAQWTPAEWFSLRAELGAVVWSEFKLDDNDGHKLNEEHGDPTAYAGLSATFRF